LGASTSICLYGWKSFWSWHILPSYYTGAANKDLCNEYCEVGFVAYYCFGQQPVYSDYNVEEHIDGNVIEYLHLTVDTSADTGEYKFDQYLSCCPPGSKTNPGDSYRCNTWTSQDNNNCHTTGLPWNDGKVSSAGPPPPYPHTPLQHPPRPPLLDSTRTPLTHLPTHPHTAPRACRLPGP
jgi:hypothetical protein